MASGNTGSNTVNVKNKTIIGLKYSIIYRKQHVKRQLKIRL